MAGNWWVKLQATPVAFPLLTKFLFPHEKLSVQVHPDDEAARQAGQPCGKTECWYVAHAKPGAQIALGLKPGVTRAQFEQAIHQERAEELLNWINVFPGEMIYVAGGTVHTLGPGSVIVETQQQSDTTYRLYDYGRPRELHLKEGLAAVKEKVTSGKVIRPAPTTVNGTKNRRSPLVASPYFVVEMFELKEPQDFRTTRRSGQEFGSNSGCGRGLRHDRSDRSRTGHTGKRRCSRGASVDRRFSRAPAVDGGISEGRFAG